MSNKKYSITPKTKYEKQYSTMQRTNLQVGKIMLALFLGVLVFGFFGDISTVLDIILGSISLVTSITITVMAYRAKKKEKYFKFKYSRQLWYLNIFLGVGIAFGIGGICNYYEVSDKVFGILYLLTIFYAAISSQIIYYAAQRKKDIYV